MNINCIMGQHRYRASDMEMYLAEKKLKSRVYRVIRKCYFCGKEKEELVEIPNPMDEAQRAYEQGVKDTLDKYDETCRIASDIRCAIGCKTAKECQDLISNGEIQRVKHGHWIKRGENLYECSECGAWVTPSEYIPLELHKFCRGCGAKMDKVESNTETLEAWNLDGSPTRYIKGERMDEVEG